MSDHDSTDWLGTAAPFLEKFEHGLRCPICREILCRNPLITECGHTFCGECIQRHFDASALCPVCRQRIQRGRLQKNKVVGDLADLWLANVRAPLLALAAAPSVGVPGGVPGGAAESAVGGAAGGAITNTAAETESGRPAAATDDSDRIGSDVEVVSESLAPAVRLPALSSSSPAAASPASFSPEPSPIAAGHAPCPSCGKVLPIREIEGAHLTRCLNETAAQVAPRSPAASEPPPAKRARRAVFGEEYPTHKLVVPHFMSLPETKLRAKARELGISVRGGKQRLIARYKEWVMLWNASADDERHPRTVAALRRQLDEWDRAQDRLSEVPASLKSLNAQEWARQNKESYDELIALARSKKAASTPSAQAPPPTP